MTGIGMWDGVVVIAKAVTYAGTLGASGGVFFLHYAQELIEPAYGRRIRRAVRLLLILSVLGSAARLPATAASMTGDLSGLYDLRLAGMILEAGEGHAILARLIGLALMAVSLSALPPRPVFALAGAMAAATSFAWAGHVHALAPAWLPPLWLAVHLSCAAFWVGALAPLLMIASGNDMPRIAAAASRFGAAALWIVGALLAAAVGLLFFLLRDVADPFTSDYGRLVLTKIAMVGCLLTLAALNHLRLTPGLIAADSAALRALKISITLEISLAAAVLLVTAAMTTLTGPPHPL